MNKSVMLKDIAQVRVGKSFKTAVVDDKVNGDVLYLSIGDINAGKSVSESSLDRLVSEEGDERYQLKPSSILLPMRGLAMTPLLLKDDFSLPVITSSHVAIIDCDGSIADPYYIQWYLGGRTIKRYFETITEGSNIKKITKVTLSNAPVELPSLEVQKQIGKVQKNWSLQKIAHEKLIDNGDAYFNEICWKLATGSVVGVN
ncbi:TPA: restriction endonuclease subunit S [Vibrio vulnificus]